MKYKESCKADEAFKFYIKALELFMQEIKTYIEYAAKGIEIAGIITLVIGTILALIKFIFTLQHIRPRSYKILREELGKAILLGLEILVAGDIIGTVVTEPTMERVLTLAVIVLIRTFLSLSIQVEIDGRFPWQKEQQAAEDKLLKETGG